ncbi:Uma2 family endonuclease [Myxococcota bacterium]|nr:Uma2 family endonuclease [Myxococcota bacterium]
MALEPQGVRPPPRAEDLPSEDGEPMDTPKHAEQMQLLLDSLRLAWADRRDFYAGGNMFFYFSETQSKRNDFRGPDVFVVLDTVQRERLSWVVWEEDGRRPDVIIELTSPSTTDVDHGPKKELYARLHIAEYFIFDPFAGTFEGYGLDIRRGHYDEIQPDARGWMKSERLGLWLGVVSTGSRRELGPPWLRWFDEGGRMLPDRAEALDVAEARARELAAQLAAYEARFGKLDR